MFALILKSLKSALLFIASSVLLLWMVEASAENISAQHTPLPYVAVKPGSDLVADGKEASKKQIPVLMMFSMKHCPYCIEVEEDFLKPMLRNSEYEGKVLIRKIRLDGTKDLRDFSGIVREPGEFSEDYNVSMVPTIVLVDAKGKRLAPSIIGLANPHYYGGELDNAIDVSLQRIRAIAKR